MTPETASALTDVALSAGTLVMGLTVGPRKSKRTWSAFFIMLALSSALGAFFHGVERFHTPAFWVLVSTTSTASAFLFVAACLCTARPHWKWLPWTWPLLGAAGMLLGGLIAPQPFWYVSIVSLVCVILSLLVLKKTTNTKARSRIYFGIAFTIFGLMVQKIDSFNSSPLNHNSAFHLLQLTGNFFFWLGARRT